MSFYSEYETDELLAAAQAINHRLCNELGKRLKEQIRTNNKCVYCGVIKPDTEENDV